MPWFASSLRVVLADNKWHTRVVVAAAVVDALASLDLHYPRVGKSKLAELAGFGRPWWRKSNEGRCNRNLRPCYFRQAPARGIVWRLEWSLRPSKKTYVDPNLPPG